MRKSKSALYPGLSLFLCFCLLTGTGKLVARFGGGAPLLVLAETASFVLPTLLLAFGMNGQKAFRKRLSFRRLPKGGWGLTVRLGVTVAVLSLFLNLLIYQLAGLTGADLSTTALGAPQTGLNAIGRFLIIVVLSAVVEECYLRGALFAVNERLVGTSVCLLASGAAFALLHGSLMNFAGPLIAGAAYAYLTYVFGSIWPAVIAHAVNNVYYLLVIWITDTYAPFGIWNYFAAINALVLLLFLYLSLRSAEMLLAKGLIPRFEKGAGWHDVIELIRNPGVAAFVIAFAAKAVFHWI